VSSGFSSWTSSQIAVNSPNNFNSQQIGSLALLASLSLGAAAMFTSAMHLSVMESSFATILSLKETKINGRAVEHYKKRSATDAMLSFVNHHANDGEGDVNNKPNSDENTKTASHPHNLVASRITLLDILAMNKASNMLQVLFLGPAYALLPERNDHIRTSMNLQFELAAKVRNGIAVLTTQRTDGHALSSDGENIEAINVCVLPQGNQGEDRAAQGDPSQVLVSEKAQFPGSETV